MKQNSKFTLSKVLILCGLWTGVVSCSKNASNEVAPNVVTQQSDIQSVDGRLIFKDAGSYVRTLESLKFKSAEELALWEKALNFSSLRTETEDKAVALKEEFRFPGFVSAVVNKQGVYQIGEKLYWFNEHKLHEFNNAADLSRAQSGQNVVHASSEAGCIKSSSAQRIISSNSGRDGLYQSDFCLGGNCGSRRKIVYETYAYTQQVTNFPSYYSVLVFAAKLEYYGRRGWRIAGDSRQVTFDLSGPVSIYTPLGTAPQNNSSLSYNSFTNGNVEQTIAAKEVAGFSTDQFGWDFTLNGAISSYVAGYQGQTYTVQGNQLW